MKRSRAILLVLVVLTALLAACTKNGPPAETPPQTPEESQTPAPVPTTAPDFTDVDFTGTWAVSAVFDSSGQAVSPELFAGMGADFTLELAGGNAYFLYDAQHALIGQGQYRVAQNEMLLSAGGSQTAYVIENENTIHCIAQDGSKTVMTRLADENEEGDAAPSDDADMNDADKDEP